MAQIAVKTGSGKPIDGTLKKGQIGLRLDNGDEAIYTGDSDTEPTTIKLTNNYSDIDKNKVANITTTEPADLDSINTSVGKSTTANSIAGKLADATCSVTNDGSTPINLQSSDLIVPIITNVATNDTTVLDTDDTGNSITFNKAGKYAFNITSYVRSGDIETSDYIISLMDGDGALIDVNSYASTSITSTITGTLTKVFSEIVVYITNADIPVAAWLKVRTSPVSSFIFEGFDVGVLASTHVADVDNPHNVTKGQVGLSNVDNTADADKPIQNAVESYIGGTLERNTVLSGGLKLDTVSTKGFGATMYVGNGTFGGQTIPTNVDMLSGTNGGFLWVKNRSTQRDFAMVDSVRSTDHLPAWRETLVSNYDYAELNRSSVAEITSGGFKPGSSNETNQDGDNFIAWAFQTTEKTTYITSPANKQYTAHYNPAMGFSIIGNKASKTLDGVPHHLGYKPELIISKNRTVNSDWWIALNNNDAPETTNGDTSTMLVLNSSASTFQTNQKYYGSNTYFSDRYSNANNDVSEDDDIIHYLFRSVPGFSKITTYVGTGASGNTVDLGLNMSASGSFVMIKCLTSDNTDWAMTDNVRSDGSGAYNLYANENSNEATIGNQNKVSFWDGYIKLNTGLSNWNAAGDQYLIMAFTSNYDKPTDGIPYVEAGTIVTHAEGFDENGAKDSVETYTGNDIDYTGNDNAIYAYVRKGIADAYRSTTIPSNPSIALNPIEMITPFGDVYLGTIKWMDGKAFAIEPAKRTSYTQAISDGTNTVTPAELRAKCDEPYIGLDGKLATAYATIIGGTPQLRTPFNVSAVVRNSAGNYDVFLRKPLTSVYAMSFANVEYNSNSVFTARSRIMDLNTIRVLVFDSTNTPVDTNVNLIVFTDLEG